ncbi:MAG: PAS domain S-box protein [Desulfobacteraceae bacterium]|nr:PAS domain S-box protein [Desulfobacteraceae bacterium]
MFFKKNGDGEDSMAKEKLMLHTILDTIDDGIYVIDQDFTVEFMNRKMIDMFGNGEGKRCYEVLNEGKSRCEWCRSEEVFKGRRLSMELFMPNVKKTFKVTELPLNNPDGTVSKLSVFRDITHRKQDQAKLKTSVEEYRTLFENLAVGVAISTKEGKFIDANQAILDILGYSDKEEFLDIDIVKDLYLFPEDRLRFQDMIENDGRVIDFEVQFRMKDGTPVPIMLTSNARYDLDGNIVGYESINVDLSQRYQMERKLREAHDFMNMIIQSAPISIMAADLKGNIIIWNREAEKTLGYAADDVIGKMNITRVYPEGKANEIMSIIRSDQYGPVGTFPPQSVLYVREDGKSLEGHLSAAMIYDDDGNEVATIGSFVDLTQRLEMERALSRTQEQLLHSEKLAAMGRLTSQIAHELNNPLFGIMNTLELMKTEIPPENKRRKLLDMSLSEIERLADMLKKMLSFSKPEQEVKKIVNLNIILDEVLMLHAKQLQENDVKIKMDFFDGLETVFASTNQLRQVFLNMISNARDAMPEGGTLTVSTASVNGFAHVLFADSGVGISEENIGQIFDSFFTTKDSVKGVGLGLSVCYGFIKDHDGDITVESTKGEGTTFTISLPIDQSEEPLLSSD